MKKTLFMAFLTAGACNSGGGPAKSIFALDATDFNHHNGYLFSQSGLTAQSGSLSSLRQALSDGGTVVGGGAWKATGLTVSKGDVLYIQAAGVLSTTTPNSTGSQSFKAGPDGDLFMVAAGRYLDTFERRAGEWKVLRRHAVYDWNRTGASSDNFDRADPGPMAFGRADREDLSYAYFQAIGAA